MRRLGGGIDWRTYVDAFPLLARTPALFLAPLVSAFVAVVIAEFGRFSTPDMVGGITSGIVSLLFFLLDSFALGVSLIIADTAWRRGTASFDSGWEEARRKAGDIFMAALGLNFIIYIAQMAGGLLSPLLGFLLFAVAFFFLMYAIPAAAIGGVPGGASLSLSIERVRSNYPAAIVLALVAIVLYGYVANILIPLWLAGADGLVALIAGAIAKAIVVGYFALVLAKTYSDVSLRRW